MAIRIPISGLINSTTVEQERIEYLPEFDPTEVLHTICAFANDLENLGGGYIVIGAGKENDTGMVRVTGISKDSIDCIVRKLQRVCRMIEPFYQPVIEPAMHGGKSLVVVRAHAGDGRPYSAARDANSESRRNGYFVRNHSGTAEASLEELQELFRISSSIPFDDTAHPTACVDDLSCDLIREHLYKTGNAPANSNREKSLQELAEDLHLLSGPPGCLRPRNVGLLMFSDQVHKYFPHACISLTVIPHQTGRNILEKKFTGPIQFQYSSTLAYIRNVVLAEKVTKVDGRAEADRVWNYPLGAVAEVLAHAASRHSYQSHEPISVRVTEKAIEIRCLPCTFGTKGARMPVNRRIGAFLKELRINIGQGMEFAFARLALRNNGSPDLATEQVRNGSALSITIPVHEDFLNHASGKAFGYQERILTSLEEKPKSLTDLARSLGYKGISKKLRDAVVTLEIQKRIRKVIGGNGRPAYAVSGWF